MARNPYQVLGVSPGDDDEKIKQAYRELARKYHPDRYTNTDLAELAGEKMKEINAAYEEIQQLRAAGASGTGGSGAGDASGSAAGGTGGTWGAYGASGGANGTGGNGTGGYGYNAGSYRAGQYSEEARQRFTLIRNCINSGNITEAERLLSETPDADRGAEWYFLTGCVQLRKGFYVDAQNSFDTAYRMEPTNNEYWTFKENMRTRTKDFGGGYRTSNSGGCNGCDVCSSLLCADCCCECMGGDLIPCC